MTLTAEKKTKPKEPKVLDFLSGVEFLKKFYLFKKSNSSKYSYRAFAAELGFGNSNYLHLICTGQRALSAKAALQIAQNLDLSARESRYLEVLAKYESAKNSKDREILFEEILTLKGRQLESSLSKSQLTYFSEWHHATIREMVRLPDFQNNPTWIVERIHPPLTLEKARQSWELLLELGYVAWSEEKEKWQQTEQNVVVPAGASNVAVIRYHQKMAELGKESITRTKSKYRDISAMSIPVDERLLFEIKEELTILKTRILEKSDAVQNSTEIYQLNLQLFPLTLKDKK